MKESESNIYFDADCQVCRGLVEKYRKPLEAASFQFIPLQQKGVEQELGIRKESLLEEMKVKTSDGRVRGGAEAVVYLARHIKSLWPLVWLSHLPFGMSVINLGYRWFAKNRGCQSGACEN